MVLVNLCKASDLFLCLLSDDIFYVEKPFFSLRAMNGDNEQF